MYMTLIQNSSSLEGDLLRFTPLSALPKIFAHSLFIVFQKRHGLLTHKFQNLLQKMDFNYPPNSEY